MLPCTVRETTSACGASPAALACALSHAIARSSGGSPTTFAKPDPTMPPQRPASSPQIRSVRSTGRGSVAGEAEEMATVVQELVDGVVGHRRDEVDLHDEHH